MQGGRNEGTEGASLFPWFKLALYSQWFVSFSFMPFRYCGSMDELFTHLGEGCILTFFSFLPFSGA